MKRAIVSLLLVGSSIVPAVGFPSSAFANSWTPATPSSSEFGIGVEDGGGSLGIQTYSTLEAQNLAANNGAGGASYCTGLTTSGYCDFSGAHVVGYAEIDLPVCATTAQENCISSLSIGPSSTTLEPATFTSSVPGPTLSAVPALDLPEGSTTSLWASSTPDAEGSDLYAVTVSVSYFFQTGDATFEPEDISASIVPVTITASPGQALVTPSLGDKTIDGQTELGVLGYEGDQGLQGLSACFFGGSEGCAQQDDFAPGVVSSLSVRLTNQREGWFVGRLGDPSVSVVSTSPTSKTVTVTAAAVTAPEFVDYQSATDPSSGAKEFNIDSKISYIPSGSFELFASSIYQYSIPAVDDLRADVNNTATATQTVWNFDASQQVESSCQGNATDLEGIVSTNAMAYDMNTPTFKNGEFSFEVAGMHYLPDGSVAHGTFNMVISATAARCLYGLTNAPISASVSVTENGGVENIATTTVRSKSGWITLASNGFTFSNPVIHVKLSQKKLKKKAKS